MYNVSPEYLSAIVTVPRTINAYLTLGANIDSTAADDITSITVPDSMPMSNIDQLIDAEYGINRKLATFEGSGIATDANLKMIAPPITSSVSPPQCGVWSLGISDGDCNLSWSMDVQFGNPHTSALTIYFGIVYATEMTVAFYLDSSLVTELSVTDNNSSQWQTETSYTYDKIVISITKISRAYRHVRIGELEFGNSVTYGLGNLSGKIDTIDDIDLTGATSPIKELNFTLINVGGIYDEDNQAASTDTFQKGLPVSLTYSVMVEGGGNESVLMGKYYIVDRDYQDTSVIVKAQDIRSTLASIYPNLTLNTSDSLGVQTSAFLTEYNIPHALGDSMDSVYLSEAYTYIGETDALTILINIMQRCGLYIMVDRDGILTIDTLLPYTYGMLPRSLLYEYPRPTASDTYNAITISNDTESWTYDLRTSTTVQLNTLSISNPLVADETEALSVKAFCMAGMYSQTYKCSYVGDPALDSADMLKIPTKFTNDSASLSMLHISSIQTEYSGLLKVILEAVK